MAIPAEVAELIIDRCQDTPTLSSCSLVCKAWHRRARFCLFSGPVKVVGVPNVEAFLSTLQHPMSTLHPYMHTLSIEQPRANPSLLNHVISALIQLDNLTSLELMAETVLIPDEAQTLLRSNFRLLRRLSLRVTFATLADAVRLVCSFEQLESLHLCAQWIGASSRPVLSLPPKLHTLALDGLLDDALGWLLSCPTSPALTCIQFRDVDHQELVPVFQYLRSMSRTVQDFRLTFQNKRAELRFLDFDFAFLHLPALQTLDITGQNDNDPDIILHMLSRMEAPALAEVHLMSFIAVNSRRDEWGQLDLQLSQCNLRKVTVRTLPHLENVIRSRLRQLEQRDILHFVFPRGGST